MRGSSSCIPCLVVLHIRLSAWLEKFTNWLFPASFFTEWMLRCQFILIFNIGNLGISHKYIQPIILLTRPAIIESFSINWMNYLKLLDEWLKCPRKKVYSLTHSHGEISSCSLSTTSSSKEWSNECSSSPHHFLVGNNLLVELDHVWIGLLKNGYNQ